MTVTGVRAQVVHQAASLLLAYPDQELLDRLPTVRSAVADAGVGDWFEPVLTHLEGQPLVESQAFHVAEFDTSRRHALHLSYWTDGDTRRRGEVLAGIKQVYRDSGLLVDLAGELPDHLPMVLEFAALGDPERGRELLQRYRGSLELLRLQLEKDQLPHAGLLQAVCATLPGPSPTSRAEVQAMVDAMPSSSEGGRPPSNPPLGSRAPLLAGSELHSPVEMVGLDSSEGGRPTSNPALGGYAPLLAGSELHPPVEMVGLAGYGDGPQDLGMPALAEQPHPAAGPVDADRTTAGSVEAPHNRSLFARLTGRSKEER